MSVSLMVLFLLSVGWMARGEDCGKFNSSALYADANSCSSTTFGSGFCTFEPTTGVCSGGTGCDAYVGGGNYPLSNSPCTSVSVPVPCSFSPADGTCTGGSSCTTGHDSNSKTFPETYPTCTGQTYPSTTHCSFNTENGQCTDGKPGGAYSSCLTYSNYNSDPFPATNNECTDLSFSAGACNYDEETGACTGGAGCESKNGTPKYPATYVDCTNVLLDTMDSCFFNEADGQCTGGAACSSHNSMTQVNPSMEFCESSEGLFVCYCVLWATYDSATLCTFSAVDGHCTGGLGCSNHDTIASYPNTYDTCTNHVAQTTPIPCEFRSAYGDCNGFTGCSTHAASNAGSGGDCHGSDGCYTDDNDCSVSSYENEVKKCEYYSYDGGCFETDGDGNKDYTVCGAKNASLVFVDDRNCASSYVQINCTYHPNNGSCTGGGNCTDYITKIYKDANGCSATPLNPLQTNCSYDSSSGWCYGSGSSCSDINRANPTGYEDNANCKTAQGTAGTCTYVSTYGSCYGASICDSKSLSPVFTDTDGCASNFVNAQCEYAGAATGECTGHAQCLLYNATANIFVDANGCGTTSTGTTGNCVYDSSTGKCSGGLDSTCSSNNAAATSFTDSSGCALHTNQESCAFAEATGVCSGNAVCSAKDSTTISTAFPNTHPACTDNDGCTYAAATGVCSGTYTDSGSGSLKIAFPAAFVVLALLFLM